MFVLLILFCFFLEAYRALRRTGHRIRRNFLCSVFSSWEHQWTASSDESRWRQGSSSSVFLCSSRSHFSNWSFPSDRQEPYKLVNIFLCGFFTSGLHGKATPQLLPVCLQQGWSSPFINRARLSSHSVCKEAFQRCKQHRWLLPFQDLPKCGCLILDRTLRTCLGEAL